MSYQPTLAELQSQYDQLHAEFRDAPETSRKKRDAALMFQVVGWMMGMKVAHSPIELLKRLHE